MRSSYRGLPINTSRNTHETVLSLVEGPRDGAVADLPCGSGAFVLRLKDAGFTRVVAMDIVNQLEIEHEGFATGDMDQGLELQDGSIDTLVCIDGIEHIKRRFDFVREVHRVLVDGGEFILSTPNTSSLRSRWRWLLTGHHHKCNTPLDETRPNPLHHIGMISFPEMRYLLHSSGFTITRVTTNRIKPVALVYALLVPFALLATLLAYRKPARRSGVESLHREVRRTMFTPEVLFGETLIVRAVKVAQD